MVPMSYVLYVMISKVYHLRIFARKVGQGPKAALDLPKTITLVIAVEDVGGKGCLGRLYS